MEERENHAKRVKTDEDERKREFERLKEEGARFRMEMDERKRRKAEEEEKAEADASAAVEAHKTTEMQDADRTDEQAAGASAGAGKKSRFTELDRTIRVRLKRKGKGETFDKTDLELLFRQFGPIEACVIKSSGGGSAEKEKKYRTALIVFEDITGAHAAVKHDRDEDPDDDWKIFRDITWASGKEPDLGVDKATTGGKAPVKKTQTSDETGSKAEPTMEKSEFPRAAPAPAPARSNGRVPTFSFNGAKASTTAPPIIPAADISTNDYESITIMRMRERAAERKRLADEIRRKEAEEDAASMKE